MIKVTKVLILLLLSFWTVANSQQLSNQVLVPAAGLATSGVINYSQTIGETAVEIVTGAGFFLTQGFQQPGMKYTAETPHEGTGVDVYPNPATEYINIKLFGDAARKFTIEMINLSLHQLTKSSKFILRNSASSCTLILNFLVILYFLL